MNDPDDLFDWLRREYADLVYRPDDSADPSPWKVVIDGVTWGRGLTPMAAAADAAEWNCPVGERS